MKTGALDDVLFPENPVADAPRIISRYKQLFPIEPDSLLLGPMLELSFSEPPIVYVRLGLIFEVRNALGGDKPAELTKVHPARPVARAAAAEGASAYPQS